MVTARTPYTVDAHFAGKDAVVRETYDRLLAAVRQFGPVAEDPKKTSIHLNRKTALAGVAVRKRYLILTIKADCPFDGARVLKSEQTSANRFHHEVKLSSPGEIDDELRRWLTAAYELS
jgi:hypothetical protein